MQIMDGWALASLIVNLGFLYLMAPLLRRPPCWMQAVTVWLFAIAMVLFCTWFFTEMISHWTAHYWFKGAAGFQHLGVLVWIWRLRHQEEVRKVMNLGKDEPEWKASSAPSPL